MQINRRYAALIIFIATLLVFNGVLSGKQINNSAYLFAFEPWVYHAGQDPGNYNYILSDDMDAMSISYPTGDLLSEGKFSFWNRFWQLGIPEFRIDSGWFYPLRVFWVLFGIPIGMTVEVILRFMLGGFFTFLLLDLIGVNRIMALFTALAYAFGSNSIGDYMYGFGPPGLTLPIVIYCVERVFRFKRPRDVISLTFSLILLNTHIMVHVNAVASIWVAIYIFLRFLSEGRNWEAVKPLAIALIFAPLLYAFALLPTLDFYTNYFNDSYRQDYSAAQLNPFALLSLFFNRFFGDPLTEPSRYIYGTYINTGIFIGFLTGVCGLVLGMFRLVFWRDKYTVITLIISVSMMLTMYGFSFESTEKLLGYMPLLKYIRPFYQKPIFQFFLMFFGALGLDYFWKIRKEHWGRIGLGIVGCIILQAIGTWYFIYFYDKNGPSDVLWNYFVLFTLIHVVLFLGLIILHPAIFSRVTRVGGQRIYYVVVAIMVGLIVFESSNAADGWIPYSKKEGFYPATETTEFLKKNIKATKVITLDRAAVPGLLYGLSIPVAAGRSLPRAPYLEVLRLAWPGLHRDHPTQSLFASEETDLSSPIWDLAGVRFFVGGKGIDPAFIAEKYGLKIKVHSFSDGTVLERVGAAPGYIATYNIVNSIGIEQTKRFIEEGFDLKNTIVLSGEEIDPSPSACSSESVKVRKFKVLPDYISATVRNGCTAFFMPSTFIDKGWKAYVDGREVSLRTGYGFMPVVTIDRPGVHTIELKYFPIGLKYGAIVSCISLLLYICVLLTIRIKPDR